MDGQLNDHNYAKAAIVLKDVRAQLIQMAPRLGEQAYSIEKLPMI